MINEFGLLRTIQNDYMERRKFLLAAGSVSVLTLSGVLYFKSRPIVYDAIIAEPGVLSQICDTDAILSIGNSYVSQTPEENSENILAKELVGNISGSPQEIVDALNEQVNKDFYNGDIVMIDGWILSRTEARQCGLLSKNQIKI
jgi:hypothetical protein